MDRCLEEMCHDFHQSRSEGYIDSMLGWSSFIQNILEELIPTIFFLLSLETFDDATDWEEHIIALWTQMSL